MDLFHPDKVVHVFIFAVYFILQIRGFLLQPQYPFFRRHALFATLLICLVMAAGTELLQGYFIPMRVGSLPDFLANLAGIFTGWGMHQWKFRYFFSSRK